MPGSVYGPLCGSIGFEFSEVTIDPSFLIAPSIFESIGISKPLGGWVCSERNGASVSNGYERPGLRGPLQGGKEIPGLSRLLKAASAKPAKAYVGRSGAWRSLVARVLWEH